MSVFVLSIFLSAFLLFQIQPMIGKFILPWFGGTPAVWSKEAPLACGRWRRIILEAEFLN